MRRFFIGLAITAVALTATACSASGGTGGTIDGTSWSLKTYDVSGTATAAPAGIRVDATFADGKVAGSAGCNVYNAPVTISGATIKVGPTATTSMACDADRTALEQAYLAPCKGRHLHRDQRHAHAIRQRRQVDPRLRRCGREPARGLVGRHRLQQWQAGRRLAGRRQYAHRGLHSRPGFGIRRLQHLQRRVHDRRHHAQDRPLPRRCGRAPKRR